MNKNAGIIYLGKLKPRSNKKVLIVDDHTLFRRGIAAALSGQDNLEIVGEAIDGLEATERIPEPLGSEDDRV